MSPRSNITVAFAADDDEGTGCNATTPCARCPDCAIARSLRRRDEPTDAEKAEMEARYLAYESGPQVPEGFSLAERWARFAAEDDGDDW